MLSHHGEPWSNHRLQRINAPKSLFWPLTTISHFCRSNQSLPFDICTIWWRWWYRTERGNVDGNLKPFLQLTWSILFSLALSLASRSLTKAQHGGFPQSTADWARKVRKFCLDLDQPCGASPAAQHPRCSNLHPYFAKCSCEKLPNF